MNFRKYLRNAAIAAAALAMLWTPEVGRAQLATQSPTFISPNTPPGTTDLGNGPGEVRILQGSANIFTSQGSGIGSTSGTSTTITLTAIPAVPPCVGCLISPSATPLTTTITIPLNTFVTAYNGATVINTSASVTIGAGAPLAWGAACPSTPKPGILLQVGQPPQVDIPFYTLARLCGNAQFAPGGLITVFPIAAH